MAKNRQRKRAQDKDALTSLTEEELRQTILIPLFEAMGFKDVRHHHGGPLEQGKDITMWKADELEHRVNYAVVAKRGDISGKVSGKQSAGEVQTQIQQCFGAPFSDVGTLEQQHVDRCWIVASGRIPKEAMNAIRSSLNAANYRPVLRFIDGTQLQQLVAKHLPAKTLWDHVQAVRDTAGKLDANYAVSLSISQDKTTIGLVPKSRSAEPPSLHFKLQFPADAKGDKARSDFISFIKKGGPLKLHPQHVTDVQMSEVMKKLVGEKQYAAFGFEFTPNVGPPVAFRFISQPDEGAAARLEYIEMRCIQAGTEEVVVTNEHQNYPGIIRMEMHGSDKKLNVKFAGRCVGHNVATVAEWLRFQRAISQPGEHVIEHVVTGTELARHRTSDVLPAPDRAVLEMAETLAFIQRKTYTFFTWPEIITASEQDKILQVAKILETGKEKVQSIEATVFVNDPRVAKTPIKRSGTFEYRSTEDQYQTILGVPVNLGPAKLKCARVEVTEVQPPLGESSPASDRKERQVVIKAAEGETLEMIYPKWLPQSIPKDFVDALADFEEKHFVSMETALNETPPDA